VFAVNRELLTGSELDILISCRVLMGNAERCSLWGPSWSSVEEIIASHSFIYDMFSLTLSRTELPSHLPG